MKKVTIEFTGDSSGLEKEIDDVSDSLKRQQKEFEEVAKKAGVYIDANGKMREANGRFVSAARKAELGLQDFKGALDETGKAAVNNSALVEKGLQKIGIGAGAIAASISVIGVQATQTGLEFERLQTALATSLGSKGAAETAFQGILDFAKATPFQVQEITESFVKLQNQGITPTEETLRRLGDIAASQGKSLEQITEAVLDAAQGEGERLKEFGIRASFAGKQAEIAFKGVNLAVEKTPEAIAEAVLSLGDLQGVAGGMEAQSRTLGGSLSNLQDNADQISLAFFELSGGAIKSVVDAANSLISGFIDLDPALQAVLFGVVGVTGALSAAVAVVAAYNLVNGARLTTELLAAAASIKSTVATTAQTTATLALSAATGKLTAAQTANLIVAAKFIAILGAIALAIEGVTAASNEYGSIKFDAATDTARESLEKFNETAANTGDIVEKRVVEPYKSWIDVVGLRASARINATRRNVADFSEDIYRNVDAINASAAANGDAQERQKLYQETLKSVKSAIADLDEEMLGTEAYDEQKQRLTVLQNLLENNAETWGITAKNEEEAKQQAMEQAKAVEAQTEALKKKAEAEAEAEKVRRDAEKRETSETREDAGVTESRAREDAQRKRQEDNAKAIADLQETQQLESAKLAEKQQADLQAKQKQFEAEQAELKEQQQSAEEKRKQDFEATLATQKSDIEDKERAIAQTEAETQANRERQFADEIESLKDAAAERRQAAEKALAKEIADRLSQQAESFGAASKTISQAGELAAAATDEERQKLQEEFNRLERQAAAIANLNLADQVFSPDQLVATAERVAGINGVKSAEDAKKLQDALAGIEAEQRKQQAEADKARELALQAELQASQQAFDDSLKAKQRAFEDETEAIKLQNETAKRDRDRAFETEIEQQKIAFETAQKERRKADEDEIEALKAEQDAILLEKRKADELAIANLKAQQEAALEEKRKSFEESERTLQRNFEDEQREKERAFNEAERLKDEASAKKIADLLATAKGETVTNVTPRFAGGAVVPGRVYLGGEINPEPIAFGNGKTAMVGVNGAELFRVPQSGMVYPSINAMPRAGGSVDNSALLSEVRQLNQTLSRRSPSGSDVYNIVGAQDPVRATIKLQQERIKQRARMARI